MMYKILILNMSLILSSMVFAQDCPQGQLFDSGLNRCVLSTQTVEDMTNARNCEGLEGDAFKECFNQNVNEEMSEAKSEGKIKGKTDPKAKYGIPAIVTLGAGYILLKKSDTLKSCGQTSMWLMLGGGVSSILGEFMAQNKYKKAVSGLAKKYKERMVDNPNENDEEDASQENIISAINENQKIAFDFQIEQEKAREKAHDMRAKTYKLAMGMYSAAAIAAIYDGITNGWSSGSCGKYTPLNQESFSERMVFFKNSLLLNKEIFGEYYFIEELSQKEILEITLRKSFEIITPVNSAFAQGDAGPIEEVLVIGQRPPAIEPPTVEFTPDIQPPSLEAPVPSPEMESAIVENNAASGGDDMLDKAIKSPIVRASVAGLLAIHSKKVSGDAEDAAKEAKDRVKILEELKASFDANGGAAFGACTAEDRANTGNPACYCFLADGQRDPSKESSGICAQVYASETSLASSKYGLDFASDSKTSGCFNKQKKFDPSCDCKKKKTTKGGDNCLRINGKLKLGSLGTVDGMKDMMQDTVRFTQGNISTSELDSANAGQLALRLGKIKDKMAINPKTKKTIAKIDNLQNKLNRQLTGNLTKGLQSGAISSPFKGSPLSSGSQSTDPKDLLSDLQNKIKINNKGNGFQKGKTLKSSKKPGLADYDFGDSSSNEAGVVIDEVGDVMKKDFAFNDINENESHSIFKIITLRYQRSAFQRLFNESKGTDIKATEKKE